MRKIFLAVAFLAPFSLAAQFQDNFSDGDFTNAPSWSGDTAKFKVNSSFQLQLNGITAADTACLSVANTFVLNAEWDFWVKLSFATSGSNYARIYLAADNQDLAAPLNGYFIQIGGSNDSLVLYRQDGFVPAKILSGINTNTNKSVNTLRIKVTHSIGGLWTVYSDTLGGTDFIPEGSAQENTYSSSGYFGVWCKYTSSNAGKFYFDDFYAGAIIIDSVPPAIKSVTPHSASIDVFFTEPVNKDSAGNPGNYFVSPSAGNPLSAARDASDHNLVHLVFSSSFQNGTVYTLQAGGISDISGNVSGTCFIQFTYYVPAFADVQINEIMADPSPPAGLPAYEYVELYNRSLFPINIDGWEIASSSSAALLLPLVIAPSGYFIITSTDGEKVLSPYGLAAGITGFPAIPNEGATLTLRDAGGKLISSVSYTDKWYRNTIKSDGGWSLEQIDPLNPCGESSNWKASEAIPGGTPGAENSVSASNPDKTAPRLLRAYPKDSLTVDVFFSETADSSSVADTALYKINNGIGTPLDVTLMSPGFAVAELHLEHPLAAGVTYELLLDGLFTDCSGNKGKLPDSVRLALPDPCGINDVVINEIMYSPLGDDPEWIELYNRSEKVIDLKQFLVCSEDTVNKTFSEIKIIAPAGYLLFPGDYIILSTDKQKIISRYYSCNPGKFIDLPSLPALSDEGDIITVTDYSYNVIDRVIYSPGWQLPLLRDTKGISLERVNPDKNSRDNTNWHSAAEDAGFATPACRNSQFAEAGLSGGEITITPEIFSPDNDGSDDLLNIGYHFSTPGFICSISVYDSHGRVARRLIQNELLGTEGFFSWDGITENSLQAPVGIYVILVEVFNLQGQTQSFKKTCVLGKG